MSHFFSKLPETPAEQKKKVISAATSLFLIKFCPCSNKPQQESITSIFKSSSQVHCLEVASKSKETLMQHLQWQELTHSLRKAKDLLVVGVRLIPDEGIGEVREGWERLLELTAHDGHHQVDLHKAKREPVLGQQHLQDGLVASCPGAQVNQVEVAARYGHLLMKNL